MATLFSKSPDEKNIHAGHRKRMRERVEKTGLTGFFDHEIIEMLMYYIYPRVNTNPLGHRLINSFGSLHGVIDAPAEQLAETGLNPKGIALLKLIQSAAGENCNEFQKRYPSLTEEDLQKELVLNKDIKDGDYMLAFTYSDGSIIEFKHCDINKSPEKVAAMVVSEMTAAVAQSVALIQIQRDGYAPRDIKSKVLYKNLTALLELMHCKMGGRYIFTQGRLIDMNNYAFFTDELY